MTQSNHPLLGPANARTTFCGLVAAWIVGLSASARGDVAKIAEDGPISYARDVRPILAEHCFRCHGPDARTRQAGLRLDVQEIAWATLESGKRAVVPNRPDESELVRRILDADPDVQMPPPDAGKPLSDAQKGALQAWIAAGGVYQSHWSLAPLNRPPLPPATHAATDVEPRNAIDLFVLERLGKKGMAPSPEADPRTLLRRASLDLTGLPPTPADVERFLHDSSPTAYENAVDRLLASPRYGERMASLWLDLARYADTDGYEKDSHRQMWPYRDWVIRALNANMPFDRFTVEQLAGDLLPDSGRDQKIATAFNRNGPTTSESGSDPAEYAAKYAIDRLVTMSSAWLGLTMQCAECHDHKFDPLTVKDFYSLMAFFNQIPEVPLYEGADSPPSIPGLTPEEVALRSDLGGKIPMVRIMQDAPTRVPTHILVRGDYRNLGEVVEPAIPAALGTLANEAPPNRLGLAQWIVSERNPLTARVTVNRLWALCFGNGLVRTLDDFGSQGDWPSHPELLDWLAVEFQSHGWDVKRLLRLIVTSRVYRQSSDFRPGDAQVDPTNEWLARGPRRRLSAEALRDNALAASGLLCEQVGGPSVFPYHPAGLWEEIAWAEAPHKTWIQDRGPNLYRRGVYTFWKRSLLHPAMEIFDAPTRAVSACARSATNTPLQSFVTLNEPSFIEAARALAQRSAAECAGDWLRSVARMCELTVARSPTRDELAAFTRLYDKALAQFRADRAAAEALLAVGELPRDDALGVPETAALTIVAQVVLNMDEALTNE